MSLIDPKMNYFERAKELEQEVRFQSMPILRHEEARTG